MSRTDPSSTRAGALQVGVQVAERQAVGERESLSHLLLNYQGSAAAPGRSRCRRHPAATVAHRHGGTMNGPIDGLLSTLDLTDTGARTTRGHLHRAVAVDAARAGLRRAGARAVARRRDAHRAGRPHHPLHARLLPAARRRAAADHLLGRPHPRRPLVLDPPHAGVPARRADPLDDRVVPGRRRGPRAPGRHARPTCPTPESLPIDRRRARRASTTPSPATGRPSARSTCGTSRRPIYLTRRRRARRHGRPSG